MSTLDDSRGGPLLRRAVQSLQPRTVAAGLSTLSFWAAIVLPVLYLPLLAAGIDSPDGLVLFLGLFGLHVLALIVGRGHVGPTGE